MKQNVALDYIKGLAILMVIVIHSVLKFNMRLGSILHIEQAVPLFLLVSAYLYFIKTDSADLTRYFQPKNLLKMINRIFVPYLIFELLIVCMQVYQHKFHENLLFMGGGIGMGSYYPWLYFQFWVALPLIHLVLAKMQTPLKGTVAVIALSAIIELAFCLLSSAVGNPELFDSIWRLFIGRYLFIICVAWLLARSAFSLKNMWLPLIASVLFTVVSRYQLLDLKPLFYVTHNYAWNGVHWPMFIYSGFLFYVLYKYLPALPDVLKQPLQWLGRNSWQVFLSQMLFFSLVSAQNMPTSNVGIQTILLIVSGIGFSVTVAIGYKWVNEKVITWMRGIEASR